MTPSQKLLKESLEVNEAMVKALHAAADLLQHCTCQNSRRQQAEAAFALADYALNRVDRLSILVRRERQKGQIQ